MANITRKISEKDYYDFIPSPPHKTGDIWTNLPTFDLLKQSRCSGVIITPSCDLLNSKTETVSYLPIITVEDFFYTVPFYPTVKNCLIKICQKNKLFEIADIFSGRQVPMNNILLEKIKLIRDKNKGSISEKMVIGLRHLIEINKPNNMDSSSNLKQFFGNDKWKKICSAIIKNSFSTDIHFLPSDGQDPLYSGIQGHSLALFRYPITIPINVLNMADDMYLYDWNDAIDGIKHKYSLASYFKEKPIRALRLKKDFLSDLLTRFISLYIRMGSPDFTKDTVSTYFNDMGGN